MKYAICFAITSALLGLCGFSEAATLGLSLDFLIDPNQDISGRNEIKAELVKETNLLYFYADISWWNRLDNATRVEAKNSMDVLSQEFQSVIYPKLTSIFGSEWKPGIDGDPKVTLLLHQMKRGTKGYVRTQDSFLKLVLPESNEREMIYFSASDIGSSMAKGQLAHEFTHLISIYQKTKLRGITEETWLEEGRADYAPTLLGYNDELAGSLLKDRLDSFLANPTDSVTEWQGKASDYGSVTLFMHYIVDHYGIGVLTDSLRSETGGIFSLNAALQKNGFTVDFTKVFTDWTIAAILNNCSYGKTYCYLNQNLKNVRLNPSLNFLPLIGKSSLQISSATKSWAGNWLKFVGGQGVLEFSFQGSKQVRFQVPYLTEDANGLFSIDFLPFDENQKGVVYVPQFGTQNKSFIIIPTLQSKTIGFDGTELSYPYSFTVSILERTPQEEAELIKQLLEQITILKKEIARVQAQLAALQGKPYCGLFVSSLYIGVRNTQEVQCLQQFLKDQASGIYPEGLVTGYFGNLTSLAVKRFQAVHGIPQTGFVGPLTRAKMNSLQ